MKLASMEGDRASFESQPSPVQLRQLGIACAVPMVAFGFMDNFIMIVAGDAIDSTLGMTLGLSTLAAAGIGNLISDIAGVWSGDIVENGAKRIGIVEPNLNDEQADHRSTKLVKSVCSALGISVGCILGMVPLVWHSDNKPVHMTNEELQLYESVFAPLCVDVKSFLNLVRKGRWRDLKKGDVIIHGGKPLTKVVVLVRGSAEGITPRGEVAHIYLANGLPQKDSSAQGRQGPMIRGCFIGGTRLMESRLDTYNIKPYKNTILASEDVRCIELDFEEVGAIMEEDRRMERALISFAEKELNKQVKQMRSERRQSRSGNALHDYSVILAAVVADGVVHPL